VTLSRICLIASLEDARAHGIAEGDQELTPGPAKDAHRASGKSMSAANFSIGRRGDYVDFKGWSICRIGQFRTVLD